MLSIVRFRSGDRYCREDAGVRLELSFQRRLESRQVAPLAGMPFARVVVVRNTGSTAAADAGKGELPSLSGLIANRSMSNYS